MIKKISAALLALLATASTAACDAPTESDVEDVDGEGVSEESDLDKPVMVARVEVTADGIGKVEQWQTTRRAQLAEAADEDGSRAGNPVGDGLGTAEQAWSVRTSGCATTDFRMWSSTNYTGYQLCFYGTGSTIVDLDNYLYGSGPIYAQWGGRVASFKPADHASVFGSYYAPASGGINCNDSITVSTMDSDFEALNEWEYFQYNSIACWIN